MSETTSLTTQPLHVRLREARRRAALTQATLAREVGCKQSAISMLESGKGDAVSRATLEKIAERLGVALDQEGSPAGSVGTLPRAGVRFCPNPECLSNFPYEVGDSILFLPRGGHHPGVYCSLCGEVLAEQCPQCEAPAAPLAGCCTQCGHSLIEAPCDLSVAQSTWVQARQQQVQAARAWVETGDRRG